MISPKRKIGNEGESIAEDYLVSKGYKILDRNVSCKTGEIDIIAQKQQCLFFVEVKRRQGSQYGSAIEAIVPGKIKKIKRTVQFLLLNNSDWQKLIPFFSVLAIDQTDDHETKIEFLPDAFQ